MNLHKLLCERAEAGRPLRVGLIGAGKFGSMFLAQAQRTPGLHLLGVADLAPDRARDNLQRVGWQPERIAAASLAACDAPRAPADLVLRGGIVRTMDEAESTAASVAVRGDRIVWVGGDAAASAWIGPETDVVELAGRLVLPGFHDAHVHALDGGVAQSDCDLHDAQTRDDVSRLVRACAAEAPGAAWMVTPR